MLLGLGTGVLLLLAGVLLLGVSLSLGRLIGGRPGVVVAALLFVPLWPLAAGAFVYATAGAGGLREPYRLTGVLAPSAAALLVWWRLRRARRRL